MRHTTTLGYVPALDGARGVAVAMVVVYHLGVVGLPGGFLGVDLFFVLSGFLITTLLLREYEANGRIDLAGFWLRRARRLLPALFLVIGAIALWAAQASPFERDQLRWDLLAALGYVANWRFIVVDNSYFAQYATPSPVTHLWSLAIEEQFYVVWPLIVLGGLAFARRHAAARPLAVAALIVAAGASVFALAVSFDPIDPSLAYYATHTRAHELLVGAIGAVAFARPAWLRRVGPRAATWCGVAAAGILVAFAVLLPDTSPVYYFGGSLLFSIACLVLILSLLASPAAPLSRLLSVRPLRWLGVISYGVYLWHWPVIVWLRADRPSADGVPLAAVALGVTIALSAASFILVERPIRAGIRGWQVTGRRMAVGAAVGALVLATITVITTRGARPLPEFVQENRELLVTYFPGRVGVVGFIGDSVAMSLYPGLVYEAAATRRAVAAAVFPGCPVGTAKRVDGDGSPFPFMRTCPAAVVKGQKRMVQRFDPSIVVWLSSSEEYDIRVGESIVQAGSPDWERAAFADWDETLGRVTSGGATVILILPLHWVGEDPAWCSGAPALTAPECLEPSLSINSLRAEYIRWAAGHPQLVIILEPDPGICPERPCPGVLDGVELRRDDLHFTPEGAVVAMHRLLDLLPDGVWR